MQLSTPVPMSVRLRFLYCFPAAGGTVRQLNSVEVGFTEGVTGVDASDLLINGQPAADVVQVSPSGIRFPFYPTAERNRAGCVSLRIPALRI